jgi:sugar/nucleoside kinase (ribokinase family)
MPDIVCLGQFTADVVVRKVEAFPRRGKALFVDDISLTNGGSACNAAVALGKLGVPVTAIGKVGGDAFGGFLLEVLKKSGVSTAGMVPDPRAKTSSTVVLVDGTGERSFLHYFGGNARMGEKDVDYGIVRKAKILHIAAAFLVPGLDGKPMARVLAKARRMGVTTCLDTAWDASGRWMKVLEPCLRHLDLFMPSLEEARILSGRTAPADIAEHFTGYGIKTVVIKMGAKGCYARTASRGFQVPAFKVSKVVDTLGAGDSFVAGLLAGLLRGWELDRCCRLANAVGACCVGAAGMTGVV